MPNTFWFDMQIYNLTIDQWHLWHLLLLSLVLSLLFVLEALYWHSVLLGIDEEVQGLLFLRNNTNNFTTTYPQPCRP